MQAIQKKLISYLLSNIADVADIDPNDMTATLLQGHVKLSNVNLRMRRINKLVFGHDDTNKKDSNGATNDGDGPSPSSSNPAASQGEGVKKALEVEFAEGVAGTFEVNIPWLSAGAPISANFSGVIITVRRRRTPPKDGVVDADDDSASVVEEKQLTREELLAALKEELVLGIDEGSAVINSGVGVGVGGPATHAAGFKADDADDYDDNEEDEGEGNGNHQDPNRNDTIAFYESPQKPQGDDNDGADNDDDSDAGFESCSDGSDDGNGGSDKNNNDTTNNNTGAAYYGRKRDAVFNFMKKAAVAVVPEAFKKPRPIIVTLNNITLRLDCSPPPPPSSSATEGASHQQQQQQEHARRLMEVVVSSVKAVIEPDEYAEGGGGGKGSAGKNTPVTTTIRKVKRVEVGEIKIMGLLSNGAAGRGNQRGAASLPQTSFAIITVPPTTVILDESVTTPNNLAPLATEAQTEEMRTLRLRGVDADNYAALSALYPNTSATHIKKSKIAVELTQTSLVCVDLSVAPLDCIRLCLLGFMQTDDCGKSGMARISGPNTTVTCRKRWAYIIKRVLVRRRRAKLRYNFDLSYLKERRRVREAYLSLLKRLINNGHAGRLQFLSYRDELCTLEMEIKFRDVVFVLRRLAHSQCGTMAMLYSGNNMTTFAASSAAVDAASSNIATALLADGSLLITVTEPMMIKAALRGGAVSFPSGYCAEVSGINVMKVGELSTSASVKGFEMRTPSHLTATRPKTIYQTNADLPFVTFSLDTPAISVASSSGGRDSHAFATVSSTAKGGRASVQTSYEPTPSSSLFAVRHKFVDVSVSMNSLAIAFTADDLFAFAQPLMGAAAHLILAATATERAYRASDVYVDPRIYALTDDAVQQVAGAGYVRAGDKVTAASNSSSSLVVTVTRTTAKIGQFTAALEGIALSVSDTHVLLITSNGSKGILTDVKCAAVSVAYGGAPISESVVAEREAKKRQQQQHAARGKGSRACSPTSPAAEKNSSTSSSSSDDRVVLVQPILCSTDPRTNTIQFGPIVCRLTPAVVKHAVAVGKRLTSLIPSELMALLLYGMSAEAAKQAEAGFVGDDATTFAGAESMSTATGVSMAGGAASIDRTFAKAVTRQRIAVATSPANRIVGALFHVLNRARRPKRMRIDGIQSIRELAPFVRRSRYPSGISVRSVSVFYEGLVDLKIDAISVSHHERCEQKAEDVEHEEGEGTHPTGGSNAPTLLFEGVAVPLGSKKRRRRAKDAALVIAITAIDASLFGDRMLVNLQRLSAEAVLITEPSVVVQVMLDRMLMNVREAPSEAYNPIPFVEMRDVRAASCARHSDASISYVNVCGQGALIENVAFSMMPRIGAKPVEVRPTITGDLELAVRVKALDMRCLTGPRFTPLNTILFHQVIPWVTALVPPIFIHLFMSSLTDISITVREGKTVLTSYNGMTALAEVCSADSKNHNSTTSNAPERRRSAFVSSASPSAPPTARGAPLSARSSNAAHQPLSPHVSEAPISPPPAAGDAAATPIADIVASLIPKRLSVKVTNNVDSMTQTIKVSNAILILHTPSSLHCAAHLYIPLLQVEAPIVRMPYWTDCPPLLSQTTVVSCGSVQAAFVACSPPSSFQPPAAPSLSAAGSVGIHGIGANGAAGDSSAHMTPRISAANNEGNASSSSNAIPGYVRATHLHQTVIAGTRIGKAYLSLEPKGIAVEVHASSAKTCEVEARPATMTSTKKVGGPTVSFANDPARAEFGTPLQNEGSDAADVNATAEDDDDMDSLYGEGMGGGGGGSSVTPANTSNLLDRGGDSLNGDVEDDGDVVGGGGDDEDDAYRGLYGPRTTRRTEDQTTSVSVERIHLQSSVFEGEALKSVMRCVEDLIAVFADVREPLSFTPIGRFRITNDTTKGSQRLCANALTVGQTFDLSKVRIGITSKPPAGAWVDASGASDDVKTPTNSTNGVIVPPLAASSMALATTAAASSSSSDASATPLSGMVVFEDCVFIEHSTSQQLASLRVAPNTHALFRRCTFIVPGCTMHSLKQYVPSDADTSVVVYEGCSWRTQLPTTMASSQGAGGPPTEGGGGSASDEATVLPAGPAHRLPPIIAPPMARTPPVAECIEKDDGEVGSDGTASCGSIGGDSQSLGEEEGGNEDDAMRDSSNALVEVDARMVVAVRIGTIDAELLIAEQGPRVGFAIGAIAVATSVHSTQIPQRPVTPPLQAASPSPSHVHSPPPTIVVTTDTSNKVTLSSITAECNVGNRRYDVIPGGTLGLTINQHAQFTKTAPTPKSRQRAADGEEDGASSSTYATSTSPTETDVEGTFSMPEAHVPLSMVDALAAYVEVLTQSVGGGGGGDGRDDASPLSPSDAATTTLKGTLRMCPPVAEGGGADVSRQQQQRNTATAEALSDELQQRDNTVGSSGWVLDATPPFALIQYLSVSFKVAAVKVTAYLPTDLPLAAFHLRDMVVFTQRPVAEDPLVNGVGNQHLLLNSLSDPLTAVGRSRDSTTTTATSVAGAGGGSSRRAIACSKTSITFVWSIMAYDHLDKTWGRLIDSSSVSVEATRSATTAGIHVRVCPLNISVSSSTLRSLSFVAKFIDVSKRRTRTITRQGLIGSLLRELQKQEERNHRHNSGAGGGVNSNGGASSQLSSAFSSPTCTEDHTEERSFFATSPSPAPKHPHATTSAATPHHHRSNNVPNLAATVACLAAEWPQHLIINEVGCPIELIFADRTFVRLRMGATYAAISPFAHTMDFISIGGMRRVPINPFTDVSALRYKSAGLLPCPPSNKQADRVEPQHLAVPISFANEDENVLFAQRSVTYVGDGIEVLIERILTSNFTEEIRVRTCCVIENHSDMHFVFGGACAMTTSLMPSATPSLPTAGKASSSSVDADHQQAPAVVSPRMKMAQLSVPPRSRVGVPLWLLDDWSLSVALKQQLCNSGDGNSSSRDATSMSAIGLLPFAQSMGGSFRSISQDIVTKGEGSRLYTKGFDVGKGLRGAAADHLSPDDTVYASLTIGVDKVSKVSTVHLHHATAGIRNGMRFALTANFYTDKGYFNDLSRRGSHVAEPDCTVFSSSHSPKERLLVVLEVTTPTGVYASTAVPLHPRNLIYDEATPCKLFKVPEAEADDGKGLGSLPGMLGSWLGLGGGGGAAASNDNASAAALVTTHKLRADTSAVARNTVDTITTDFIQVYLMAGVDASMPVLHVAPHPDFVYLTNRTSHSLRLHPMEVEDIVAGIGSTFIPTASTAYVRSGAYQLSTRETYPSTTISIEQQIPPSIVACNYTNRSTLVCEKFMLQLVPTTIPPCSVQRLNPDVTTLIPFKSTMIEIISPYVIANGSRTERLVVETRARNRTSNTGGSGLITVIEPLGIVYLSRCSHERKYVNEFRIAFAAATSSAGTSTIDSSQQQQQPREREAPRFVTTFSEYITDDGIKRDFALMPMVVVCKASGRARHHILRIARPSVTGPTELFVGEVTAPPLTIVNASRHVLSECAPLQTAFANLSTLDPHILLHVAGSLPQKKNLSSSATQEEGQQLKQGLVSWETLSIGFADSSPPFIIPKATLVTLKEAEARAMGAGEQAAREYGRLSVAAGNTNNDGAAFSRCVEEIDTDDNNDKHTTTAKANGVTSEEGGDTEEEADVPLFATIKAFNCEDHLRRFILVLLPPATAERRANNSGHSPTEGALSVGSVKVETENGAVSTPTDVATDADLDAHVASLLGGEEALHPTATRGGGLKASSGHGTVPAGGHSLTAAPISGKGKDSAVQASVRTDTVTISFSVVSCCVSLLDHPLHTAAAASDSNAQQQQQTSDASKKVVAGGGASPTVAESVPNPNTLLINAMVPIVKIVIGNASLLTKFKRVKRNTRVLAALESTAANLTAAVGSKEAEDESICIFEANIENLSAVDLTEVNVFDRASVTAHTRTALDRCGFSGTFVGMDPPLQNGEVQAKQCTALLSPIHVTLTERLLASMLKFSKNAVWVSSDGHRANSKGALQKKSSSSSSSSDMDSSRGFLSQWKRSAFLQCRTLPSASDHDGDAVIAAMMLLSPPSSNANPSLLADACLRGLHSARQQEPFVPSPIRSDSSLKYLTTDGLLVGELSLAVTWERPNPNAAVGGGGGGDLIDSKIVSYLLNSVKRMNFSVPEFRRDKLTRVHIEGLRTEIVWHYIYALKSQWRSILTSFSLSQLSSVTEGIGYLGGKVIGFVGSVFSRNTNANGSSSAAAGNNGSAAASGGGGGLSGVAASIGSSFFGGEKPQLRDSAFVGSPTDSSGGDCANPSWLCFHCHVIESLVQSNSIQLDQEGMRQLLKRFGPIVFIHHTSEKDLAKVLTRATVIPRAAAMASPPSTSAPQSAAAIPTPTVYYRLEGVQHITNLLPLIRYAQIKKRGGGGGGGGGVEGTDNNPTLNNSPFTSFPSRVDILHSVPPRLLSLRHAQAASAHPLPPAEDLCAFDLSCVVVGGIILNASLAHAAATTSSSSAASNATTRSNVSPIVPAVSSNNSNNLDAFQQWERAYVRDFIKHCILSAPHSLHAQ